MKFILVLFQFCVLIAGYSIFFNQWISPKVFPLLNLIPLIFPIIFTINAILLLLWWFYRWKLGLIFTILSMGLIFPINKTFHFYGDPETNESNLKVLSYNVHYFQDDEAGIISILEKEKPDVIFMQEINAEYQDILNNLEYTDNIFFENFKTQVTVSKYPIIESKKFEIKPHRTALSYTDIALPCDTVRFINFYLEPLHIDQTEVKEAQVNSELKLLADNLAKKVIIASRIHQLHIDSLLNKITDTQHPIIMGGDMNAVPNTYEYYTLTNGRKDPFLYGGKGLGSTFPGFGYPIRLDYIFIPHEFKTKSYRIEPVPYSDHYPVIVELEIP